MPPPQIDAADLGIASHFGRRALRDDFSVIDDYHPVRHGESNVHVVFDQNDGKRLVEADDQVESVIRH